LPGDPSSTFLSGKLKKRQEERKGAYKKGKKEQDPNSRAQPPKSGDCAKLLAQLPAKDGSQGRLSGSSTY
jgi:hypothetical protein